MDRGWVLAGAILIVGVGAALLVDAWLSRQDLEIPGARRGPHPASSIADEAQEWLRAQARRSNPTG